jgi:hypothetical protein
LVAGTPGESWRDLAALPVGRRDRRLLRLWEITFGTRVDCLARCPGCAEVLEFTLDTSHLRGGPEAEDKDDSQAATDQPSAQEARNGDLLLRYRLPNSTDLMALETCSTTEQARALLVERSLLQAKRGDNALEPSELSVEDIRLLAAEIAEADPLAEILIDLICPHCDHHWQTLFDIAAFFWAEVTSQAGRLLDEVHVLARSYGWREADILAMSARRRRSYLERFGA